MSNTEAENPVGYMERTRLYYRALGYDGDYVWAKFEDVPFAQLGKPLADARIALVTTARPPDESVTRFRANKKVWSGNATTPPVNLNTEAFAWDKDSTHTRDRESFLPINAVAHQAAQGVIAGLTASFHGVPTKYSQRETQKEDAPEVLLRLKAEGADAAILSPL